jgi:hypothetical protein
VSVVARLTPLGHLRPVRRLPVRPTRVCRGRAGYVDAVCTGWLANADGEAYTLANNLEKALKAYEKAHAWQELFTLALQQKLPKQAIVEMCGRVTGR